GTATAGSDYTATSGTASFAAGQRSFTFTVPVLTDTIVEGDETLTLTLGNVSANAVLGSLPTAVLTITDVPPPSLRFSAATYVASESDGNAVITIVRGGDLSQAVTVDYATSDGTEIGRASCREREEMSVGAVTRQKEIEGASRS